MTDFKEDIIIAVTIMKRNTIPLSKNRQLARKRDQNRIIDQKRGAIEAK